MTEILKKTAGLIYSGRYVVTACALAIYVIGGIAYFVAFKYWPGLPATTQAMILEGLASAQTAPL